MRTNMSGRTRARKSLAPQRRLLLERLEERCLMDGAAARLVDDAFEAWTNQPTTTLNVLANDEFDRGYAGLRRITSVSYGSEGGRVEIAANHRALTYTPPPDFEGDETFVYLVDDTFAAEVTVSVVSPVETEDDEFEVVHYSGPAQFDVLANDAFLPAYTGARRIRVVSETTAGSRVEIIDQGRHIRYTPAPDAVGFDSFSYFVDDGFEAEVAITLLSPIETASDHFEIVQGSGPVDLDVLGNDSFRSEYVGPKRISVVSETSAGSDVEIIDGGQRIRYAPAPDASGSDQFTYSVDDRFPATVSITLYSPVRDDAFEVRENQPARLLDVLANDNFSGGYGERRITSVSDGSAGGRVQLTADRRAVLYTPPPDFEGEEKFVYVVDDTLSARVTVTIVSPVVADQFDTVQGSGPIELDVRANDAFWPDYTGPRLIQFVSETSAGGDVEIIDAGRRIRYTPSPDAAGSDSFEYFVDDGFSAKVWINLISPVRDDSYEVVEESTGNVLDLTRNDVAELPRSGRTVDAIDRITSVTAVTPGATVEITTDGQGVRYTPPPGFIGNDRFEYVADGHFRATVWVDVRRAVADDYVEVDQGSTDNPIRLTSNDVVTFYRPYRTEDVVDRITSVSAPEQGGTVEITGDGQTVRYTPPPGFIGTDQFEYVADGRYRGTVTVRVTRPVRDDYSYVFQDGLGTLLAVLANDFLSRSSAGSHVITSVTVTAQGGTVGIVEDGRAIRYTPPPRFVGSDSFTYTVDGEFDAQVSVNVQSRARDDYYTFCVAPTLRLPVLDNDAINSWEYSGPGRITAATDTSGNGTITVSDDGRQLLFTATRPAYFYSTIRYTVDDQFDGVATLSVYGNYLWWDNFTVDQNSPQKVLDVLANDRFDDGCRINYDTPVPYRGPRVITAVTQSANGGEVIVSPDGRTVRYTPAADFFGYDSFTYVVDGIMQTTASVNVIRRVRDDRFRVGHNTTDNRLAVLMNDGFGTDWAGARQITAVTATSAGGSLTISDDGRSIRYTPPADFSGTDSFGYTVDGQLKAQVKVFVQPSDVLPRFASDDALEQWLIDRTVKQYGYLLDDPSGIYQGNRGNGWTIDLIYNMAKSDTSSLGGSATPSFSDTNVQVQGVDEGDIIENDGRYLYVLTGGQLVIAEAWPAKQLHESSRLALDGTPIAMFRRGDRLTVISNHYEQTPLPEPDYRDGFYGGAIDVCCYIDRWRPIITKVSTRLTVIDVADRSAPRVLETAEFEGNYVDSRAIGDHVYLVLDNQLGQSPAPNFFCEPTPPNPATTTETGDQPVQPQTCRYETRDEYIARLRADRDALFSQAFPHVAITRPGDESPTTSLVHAADDIVQPLVASAGKLVSIVSFDIAAGAPHIADTEGVLTGGAAKIYGSLEHLFVFDQDWSSDQGTTTPILEFAWNDPSGNVQLVSTGEVPGQMLNQFSADEHAGYLRIATTVDGWLNPDGRSHNALFVLDEDHGILELVGGLQDLAPGETIRSMRFVGDRGFMTTFREIDPLFAIDLSDPANPRVTGSLHIPGFSSYMQPIDANHLLTIGLNTVNGWDGPPQVSLFDIRDMTRPLLIDTYTFERFSTSEATLDHHAFGYFAEHQLLAIPTGRTYPVGEDTDGDGFRETRRWVREEELLVFRIDVTPRQRSDDGIRLLGSVEQTSTVRRSAYIGDVLYSVATGSIKAVAVSDPNRVIAELDFGLADPDGYGISVTRVAATLATDGDPPPGDPVDDPPNPHVPTMDELISEVPDASASVIDDPAAPGDSTLVIVGTAKNDRIAIRSVQRGHAISVRLNGKFRGLFDAAAIDRILVDGRDGNDSVRIAKRLHMPVELQGPIWGSPSAVNQLRNDHFFATSSLGDEIRSARMH